MTNMQPITPSFSAGSIPLPSCVHRTTDASAEQNRICTCSARAHPAVVLTHSINVPVHLARPASSCTPWHEKHTAPSHQLSLVLTHTALLCSRYGSNCSLPRCKKCWLIGNCLTQALPIVAQPSPCLTRNACADSDGCSRQQATQYDPITIHAPTATWHNTLTPEASLTNPTQLPNTDQ
jgi:hypothetical protein